MSGFFHAWLHAFQHKLMVHRGHGASSNGELPDDPELWSDWLVGWLVAGPPIIDTVTINGSSTKVLSTNSLKVLIQSTNLGVMGGFYSDFFVLFHFCFCTVLVLVTCFWPFVLISVTTLCGVGPNFPSQALGWNKTWVWIKSNLWWTGMKSGFQFQWLKQPSY